MKNHHQDEMTYLAANLEVDGAEAEAATIQSGWPSKE